MVAIVLAVILYDFVYGNRNHWDWYAVDVGL